MHLRITHKDSKQGLHVFLTDFDLRSRLKCFELCVQHNCVAVNYHKTTVQCELLNAVELSSINSLAEWQIYTVY